MMAAKNISVPDTAELARYERAAEQWAERVGMHPEQAFSAFARAAMRRMIEAEALGPTPQPQ